jgi:hypothetical protein
VVAGSCRLTLYKFPPELRSWLPTIARWLPHSWIDNTQITAAAVKRDDAHTAVTLWNQRLLLLYPRCSERLLDFLRTRLLCSVRHRLLRGLRMYLRQPRHHFGSSWADSLQRYQRVVRSGESSSCSKDKGTTNLCRQGEKAKPMVQPMVGVAMKGLSVQPAWIVCSEKRQRVATWLLGLQMDRGASGPRVRH